jgi:hypothetical protein
MIDVFIPCHEKDQSKLRYCINSIRRNVIDKIGKIYICSPTGEIGYSKCISVKDSDVLPMPEISYRPNWQYQQLLKIFQKVTTDLYLVVDVDTMFIKPVKFFENNKPVFWITHPQDHKPYFEFAKQIGVNKKLNDSFISDFMLFDRGLIRKMISDVDSFLDLFKLTSQDCHFSEFETYGNFALDNYFVKTTSKKQLAKHTDWSESEIVEEIVNCKENTLSLHTWS